VWEEAAALSYISGTGGYSSPRISLRKTALTNGHVDWPFMIWTSASSRGVAEKEGKPKGVEDLSNGKCGLHVE